MIRIAVDENFDHHVLRALARLLPELDALTVQKAGLLGADDPAVLAWAATEGRVLLTHDVRTVTRFAYERVTRGEPMPGVIEVPSPSVKSWRTWYSSSLARQRTTAEIDLPQSARAAEIQEGQQPSGGHDMNTIRWTSDSLGRATDLGARMLPALAVALAIIECLDAAGFSAGARAL